MNRRSVCEAANDIFGEARSAADVQGIALNRADIVDICTGEWILQTIALYIRCRCITAVRLIQYLRPWIQPFNDFDLISQRKVPDYFV